MQHDANFTVSQCTQGHRPRRPQRGFLYLACILFLTPLSVHAVTAYTDGRLATLENPKITESSGVCASYRNPGVYWTHNDSSSGPYAFAFDETGKDLGSVNFCYGSEDIEDCASFYNEKTKKSYLVIGNIGSHVPGKRSGTPRPTRMIYIFEEPIIDRTLPKSNYTLKRYNDVTATDANRVTPISITSPDASFDFEALAVDPKGIIYIATKGTSKTNIYAIKTKLLTGDPAASEKPKFVTSLSGSQFNRVSGMDISPDGRSMVFITSYSRRVTEYTLPVGSTSWESNPFSACTITPYGGLIASTTPQPEGICYSADGTKILSTSELGGNVSGAGSVGRAPLYMKLRQNVTPPPPPVNHVPIAQSQNISTVSETPKSITLNATDVDGQALTYSIARSPLHGTLTGSAPNFIYQPNVGYVGSDSFNFIAHDGIVASAAATVAITIAAHPVTTYALTVVNGGGDGNYAAGVAVSITADAAPSGHTFAAWTGGVAGVANVSAASTILMMSAASVTITATYKALPPPPPAVTVVYEAEKAKVVGANIVASFVDYLHPSDDYIEWSVNAPREAIYTLGFRYAHSSGDRPLKISVDGVIVAEKLSFPATGSVSRYATVSLSTLLKVGSHTIRATAIGSSGGNMDSLTVTPTPLAPSGIASLDIDHIIGFFQTLKKP